MLSGASAAQTPLTTELVIAGLDAPVGLAVPPGDHARLFVVEQPGRVRIVAEGVLLPTPFLDIAHKVNFTVKQAEQGLFDLAFDPQYGENGFFYVSYTASTCGFFSKYGVRTKRPASRSPGSGLPQHPRSCLFVRTPGRTPLQEVGD